MIGWMASDFFERSPMLAFPLIALAIFFTVFMAVNLVVMWKGKKHYSEAAQLPFAHEKAVDHE